MTKVYIKENGKKVTIEVSDEVAVVIAKTRRDIWKSEAKAQYHNTSLDGIEENGAIFASEELSPLDEYIENEDRKIESLALRQAISTLAPEQQKLVYWVYAKGISQDKIAEKLGVGKQAISNRMQRIYAQLKKYIKEI